MGNDGGSIPKRRELVKEAARALTVSELKANAVESLAHAWTHDPLTTEPLDLDNVVSDWRGRLYNYEAILQGLMPSSSDDVAAATAASPPSDSQQLTFASTGIKSLRDIVKLKFHRITPPGAKTPISACPISLKELGPATKAVYLVPCGHVFAEAAIREIHHHHHQQQQQQQQKEEEKKDESACPECSEAFESRDAVPILSADVDGGDLARLSRRMDELRASGLTHSLKKDKKAGGKKKRKAEDDGKGEKREERKTEKRRATDEAVANKGAKKEVSNRMSGINNAMAASLTAKVLAEQEELSKRRKFASSLRA